MIPKWLDLEYEAQKIIKEANKSKTIISLAESCTGGLISGCLISVPGASDVVDCGYVTYSNDAKVSALGVHATTITKDGAVSHKSAQEMSRGALIKSKAHISISVTGIAGPGGGSDEKPVGLVFFGLSSYPNRKERDNSSIESNSYKHKFCDFYPKASRNDIIMLSIKKALDILYSEIIKV